MPAGKDQFQLQYGVLIYNYPKRYLKVDSDKAGDFYLYAFENDRIFRRLEHFRGERISFENFLKYYVLKDMCLEWLRASSPKLYTESLDDPDNGLENRLPTDDNSTLSETSPWMDCVIQVFKQPAFLILRILHLADFPVLAEDIRQIAAKTNRELADVAKWIAGIENQLGDRNAAVDSRSDQLAIQHWRRLMYQKRLVQIETDMAAADPNTGTDRIRKLKAEKIELERKYAWRLRQVEAMTTEGSNQTGSTPYKDIAELLKTTVGAVSAKIYKTKARLKLEISRLCGEEAKC